MTAQLFVVATPIGHLDDISIRAINVLKSVSLIAAEDTRQSASLLKHYQINTPLTACHDHNEEHKVKSIIEKLQQGNDVALISDAGTPLISDPGFRLVRAAQEANIRVTPVPGACAAIAALSSVGLASDRFMFLGFLATKSSQRQQQLQGLQQQTATMIFYEAPHRIVDCLSDICEIFGAQRKIGFAREITKTFETIVQKPVGELLEWVKNDHNQQKGEIVLVVEGATVDENQLQQQQVDDLLLKLLKELSVKSTAEIAADITGIKKKQLYQRALELQQLQAQ
ncbi:MULTISPECIES: 16S rRNA (cytidine(1402)-2'-O)-methyltransferase [unclassified Acinetobacter]|uniref:16S rRNA (cytidine(1402)-2'-O)-methyltransferase n=1 Tax=unclassified Acinetobacter TaxID=196816 RepID=UPI0035B6E41D